VAGSRNTVALVAILAACSHKPPPQPATEPDPLVPLRAFEQERRAQAKFAEAETSDRTFGADPYDLVALGDGKLAGILRGRDAVVLLDDSLAETARITVAKAPSALAAYEGPARGALRPGDLLVTSEVEPVITHLRDGKRLADIPLAGVTAARAIAVTPNGTIHVVEEHSDSLVSLTPRADGSFDRKSRALPRGPMRIAKTANGIVVASVTGHTLTVIDDAQVLTTKIDGPFWSVAAHDVDAGTIIVAGGAEDHPLDRREGFFGFVDSFVYVFFRAKGGAELVRVAAINTSEHHVVLPKAIAFTDATHATVAGYASPRLLHLAWTHGPSAPPEISTSNAIPGTSTLVATPRALVAANPLADAWILYDGKGPRVVHVTDDRPTPPRVRLGEALFFTELMAPSNKTDGALSRFTCETCHFEGYVDGRTHHTGRGDVHATTKPLVGLFNNRPHFSRALDPDLSAVAENEFRVAGAHSGTDPHFAVDAADPQHAWLGALRLDKASYTAVELRLAFMDFLMAFSHRPNPRAVRSEGGRSFSALERRGAEAFRDKCEGCHQARVAADVADSRVAFDRWESLVLSERGPLVWASEGYQKTGVVPYVHENGARTPSLRRLYKKKPYFTNGTAGDVRTVLERVRFVGSETKHDGTTEGAALDRETIESLEAFLDLL
jgi:hypothetical protein